MMALLDTDVCIDLLRQREPLGSLLRRLRSLLTAAHVDEVGMSAVTLAELQEGVRLLAASSRPPDTLTRLAGMVPPLPFDSVAAAAYGELVGDPEYRQRRIGPLDEMIAAHALALGAQLVTGNTREFGRVHGLEVVAWRR